MIDMAVNEKDSGQTLLMKSKDDQLAGGRLQQSSTEIISNEHNNPRENFDSLEEKEKDERRIVASKLLERQG